MKTVKVGTKVTKATKVADIKTLEAQLKELREKVKAAKEAAMTEEDRARRSKNRAKGKARAHVRDALLDRVYTRNNVRKAMKRLVREDERVKNSIAVLTDGKWHSKSARNINHTLNSNGGVERWIKSSTKLDKNWQADKITPRDLIRLVARVAAMPDKKFRAKK